MHGQYLQAGGANIDVLRENIDHARKELARAQSNLAQYQALARNLGLRDHAEADHLIGQEGKGVRQAVTVLDFSRTMAAASNGLA